MLNNNSILPLLPNVLTKTFTLLIIALLSISVSINGIVLYSFSLSLMNQGEMLHNQDDILLGIKDSQYQSDIEQMEIKAQLSSFMNRTDITLNQTTAPPVDD